jgi:hypothetical protein
MYWNSCASGVKAGKLCVRAIINKSILKYVARYFSGDCEAERGQDINKLKMS